MFSSGPAPSSSFLACLVVSPHAEGVHGCWNWLELPMTPCVQSAAHVLSYFLNVVNHKMYWVWAVWSTVLAFKYSLQVLKVVNNYLFIFLVFISVSLFFFFLNLSLVCNVLDIGIPCRTCGRHLWFHLQAWGKVPLQLYCMHDPYLNWKSCHCSKWHMLCSHFRSKESCRMLWKKLWITTTIQAREAALWIRFKER